MNNSPLRDIRNTEIDTFERDGIVLLKKMFDHFDNFEHWGLFEGSPKGYFVKQSDGTKRHLTDITGEKVTSFLKKCQSDQRAATERRQINTAGKQPRRRPARNILRRSHCGRHRL